MSWPSTAPRVRLLLVLVMGVGMVSAAWWVWRHPAVRGKVAFAAVAPFGGVIPFETMPGLRVWATRELTARQTPSSLLAVIRLLNTVDPHEDPVFAAKLIEPLRLASGHPGPGEWAAQLSAANRWVAERLGCRVDANGGVLGWFAVTPDFQGAIDTMAGGDARAAWAAWSGFGAGRLPTSEAFLFAVGSALADPRPIAFAIRRTSAPGEPLRVEGRPEAPHGDVQARTVGEALGLRLWHYQGISSGATAEDFNLWWAGFARRRLLPPAPSAFR